MGISKRRRKGICPQNVVAATIKSAEAAKIKTSQPDALPAKDAAPVPTEGGNILQPEGPATASMESVQTADVKTSDTDTLGAKSLKSAGTPGVDSLPANCEPSPSLARGTSPSEKATQGTCFQKNTLLISPFSGGSDTATTSKTAPVGTPSKPSDVEPQLVVKTVAGAESRDRHPGKVVIVKPRHATSRAPGDGHAGDRGDARVTTTSASTNKEGDDDVLGGEMKTAEEVERQRSHGCLTRESAVHSLQKGPTAKALGETSNDALAPKENKLMMKRDSIRGAARGEKRGDAEQGKNEKPVSKKAKIQAKDTPPPLNRDPIGVEFMLSGFYCKLCSSFFSKEDFVRKHCHKHQHQQNLQKKETR
uniref:Matrin-3-like isoform X4 n=1 Tax=Petromyzon marinus TaxID=7757 RepID=A0AAJ7WM20_PETMA|nr:matrin-3-like isoform X4 [Petromyzon marinus]